MRNSKKLKQKKKEINILIGASATIIAAFIMRGKSGNSNIVKHIDKTVCLFNEDYIPNAKSMITIDNNETININNDGVGVYNEDGTVIIYKIQSNEATEQDTERERPYTVRETYTCEQAGEPGKEYNLVCVDTRMSGSFYITYWIYDVTYY